MAEQSPVRRGEVFTKSSSPPPAFRRLFIGSSLVLFVLLLATWAAFDFFARNHVKFLLNQRQYVEALAEIRQLQEGGEGDARLLALEAQSLAVMGEYDAAVAAGRKAVGTDDAPGETYYWLALAEYQSGQTSSSQVSAADFLKTDITLPNGGGAIARALAGERNLIAPPDLNGLPFRLLFPVEQGTYLGFAADEQARAGNHGLAASLYRDAFIRGARNPQMMQRAVVSAALAGDREAAQMFLDTGGPEAIRFAIDDLSRRQGVAGQPRLRVLGGGASSGGGRLDAARALAWTHSRGVKPDTRHLSEETSAVFTALLHQFPHDAAIQLSLADALAAAGDDAAAREIRQQLQHADPTLETWLHLDGSGLAAAELMKTAEPFIQRLGPLGVLSGAEVAVKTGEISDADGSVRYFLASPLELPGNGAVAISLIMRSPPGASSGMPIYIRAGDSEDWRVCYGAPVGWSLSTVQFILELGPNQIELSSVPPGFGKQSKQVLPEIAGLIVTNPAGAIGAF